MTLPHRLASPDLASSRAPDTGLPLSCPPHTPTCVLSSWVVSEGWWPLGAPASEWQNYVVVWRGRPYSSSRCQGPGTRPRSDGETGRLAGDESCGSGGKITGRDTPGETGPPGGGGFRGWASGVQGEKPGSKGGQTVQTVNRCGLEGPSKMRQDGSPEAFSGGRG